MAARARSDSSIDDLPSWTGPGKIIRRRDAVGSTTAVDGAAVLIEIAGPSAPADFARTDVPAIAGTRFLAVAEVHSSAVDIEGEPSIISTDGQRSAVVSDPMVAPRKDGGLRKEMSVLEPLEHSVLGLSLEGGDVCGDEVVGLHLLKHSGVDDMTGGTSGLELLEHSVPKLPLDERGQLIGNKTVSNPLESAGASSVESRCPLPVRRCTRREPEKEEVVCKTLVGELANFRTFGRRSTGFPQKKGKQLSWGPLGRQHRGF